MCQPFGSLSNGGYGLALVWPGVTMYIEKFIILLVFLSLLPGITP